MIFPFADGTLIVPKTDENLDLAVGPNLNLNLCACTAKIRKELVDNEEVHVSKTTTTRVNDLR